MRDFAAGVVEQCRRVEERSAAAEMRHRELVCRLERAEVGLSLLQEALPRRRQRIATLREQLSLLRTGVAVEVEPPRRVSRPDRLGTALIYAGCLVLVWLLLWQLSLAFGLR
jgi:hypothetical protein